MPNKAVVGIVMNKEYIPGKERTFRRSGFEVVSIGGDGDEPIPKRVTALFVDEQTCSHKASTRAVEWGRETGKPCYIGVPVRKAIDDLLFREIPIGKSQPSNKVAKSNNSLTSSVPEGIAAWLDIAKFFHRDLGKIAIDTLHLTIPNLLLTEEQKNRLRNAQHLLHIMGPAEISRYTTILTLRPDFDWMYYPNIVESTTGRPNIGCLVRKKEATSYWNVNEYCASRLMEPWYLLLTQEQEQEQEQEQTPLLEENTMHTEPVPTEAKKTAPATDEALQLLRIAMDEDRILSVSMQKGQATIVYVSRETITMPCVFDEVTL